jgi:hypothetical protein
VRNGIAARSAKAKMPKYLGSNLMFIVRFAFLEALFFIVFVLSLCERALCSRLTLRKEGQGDSRGRILTDLAPARLWQMATESVNAIFFASRRFQFQKRSQDFMRTFSRSPKSNRASCASASVTAQADLYTRWPVTRFFRDCRSLQLTRSDKGHRSQNIEGRHCRG